MTCELVRTALEWLSERTRVTPTDWALGIEARVRALLSDGDVADRLYRESIERLGQTRVARELGRAPSALRRVAATRAPPRRRPRTAAHRPRDADDDGRSTRSPNAPAASCLATGETVRKRTVETRDELTAQETQIALLARDGLSNPEIGTRLFISPRTVKYHLRKVFIKLDIGSRNELDGALPP